MLEIIYEIAEKEDLEQILESMVLILETCQIKHLTTHPIPPLTQPQCNLLLKLRHLLDSGNRGYLFGTDLILLYQTTRLMTDLNH